MVERCKHGAKALQRHWHIRRIDRRFEIAKVGRFGAIDLTRNSGIGIAIGERYAHEAAPQRQLTQKTAPRTACARTQINRAALTAPLDCRGESRRNRRIRLESFDDALEVVGSGVADRIRAPSLVFEFQQVKAHSRYLPSLSLRSASRATVFVGCMAIARSYDDFARALSRFRT